MSVLTKAMAEALVSEGNGHAAIPDAVTAIGTDTFRGTAVTGLTFGAGSLLQTMANPPFTAASSWRWR